MLMRSDPFRDLDRLTQQLFGSGTSPASMPMDAYRQGDQVVVEFDLPGVESDSIELTVEKNVVSVSVQRQTSVPEGANVLASERPQGTFSRQLMLGDNLDVDRLAARYSNGVLTLTIPVAEQAKPRKLQVSSTEKSRSPIDVNSSEQSRSDETASGG